MSGCRSQSSFLPPRRSAIKTLFTDTPLFSSLPSFPPLLVNSLFPRGWSLLFSICTLSLCHYFLSVPLFVLFISSLVNPLTLFAFLSCLLASLSFSVFIPRFSLPSRLLPIPFILLPFFFKPFSLVFPFVLASIHKFTLYFSLLSYFSFLLSLYFLYLHCSLYFLLSTFLPFIY